MQGKSAWLACAYAFVYKRRLTQFHKNVKNLQFLQNVSHLEVVTFGRMDSRFRNSKKCASSWKICSAFVCFIFVISDGYLARNGCCRVEVSFFQIFREFNFIFSKRTFMIFRKYILSWFVRARRFNEQLCKRNFLWIDLTKKRPLPQRPSKKEKLLFDKSQSECAEVTKERA